MDFFSGSNAPLSNVVSLPWLNVIINRKQQLKSKHSSTGVFGILCEKGNSVKNMCECGVNVNLSMDYC